VQSGHLDLMKWMMNERKLIPTRWDELLSVAARHGHQDVCGFIIDQGATDETGYAYSVAKNDETREYLNAKMKNGK